MIPDKRATVINIEVAGAQKPMIRHGVFHGRDRVCDVEDDIQPEYLDKYVVVRFRSGLVLNCRGDQVAALRNGRQ